MDSVFSSQFPSVEESLKNRTPLKEWKCNDTRDYEKIKAVGKEHSVAYIKQYIKKEQKNKELSL